jgi:hypothetical protein
MFGKSKIKNWNNNNAVLNNLQQKLKAKRIKDSTHNKQANKKKPPCITFSGGLSFGSNGLSNHF